LISEDRTQNYFRLDPNFPSRLRTSGYSVTLTFLRSLLEDYTRRGISESADRSVAISGLMARIGNALPYSVHHGIIEWYFHRTLLWQRLPGPKMAKPGKIKYKESCKVPSWSWMTFEGAVNFVHDEHGDLDVIKDFTFDDKAITVTIWKLTESCTVTREEKDGMRQVFNETMSSKGWIDVDEEDTAAGLPNVQYVVIVAKRRKIQSDNLLYFVLFVRPLGKPDGYERFGMGMLRADCALKMKAAKGHIF
jgi:hypothetical protein